MKRALIDTDILSYFLKGEPTVIKNFQSYLHDFSTVEISIITYYEILRGLKFKNAQKQLAAFKEFAKTIIIHPLTLLYVTITTNQHATLKKSGNTIDDIDLLIAGIAIENNLVLVTNNEKHFGRIP